MSSQSAQEKDITWEDVFVFLSNKKSTILQNKPFSKVSPDDIDFLIDKLKGVYKRDQFLNMISESKPQEVLTSPVQNNTLNYHSRCKSDLVLS